MWHIEPVLGFRLDASLIIFGAWMTSFAARHRGLCSDVQGLFGSPGSPGLGEKPTYVRSFANAEIAEDHVEQIFDIDHAGDTAEAAQGLAQIFGAEFRQRSAERALQ